MSTDADYDPTGKHRAIYIISVAAELAGVHPQTLRVYEKRGLLAPARTGGMSRRYSDADLERIRLIQALTNEGMNLVGVERVLKLSQEVERLQGQLEEAEARLRAQENSLVPIKAEYVQVSVRTSGRRASDK